MLGDVAISEGDNSENLQSPVWYSPDGSAVRCSRAAYLLLRYRDEGLDAGEVRIRFSQAIGRPFSLDQIRAAQLQVAASVDGISMKRNIRRQGILWHSKVLDDRSIAGLTIHLAKFFQPLVMYISIAFSMILLLIALCVALGHDWHLYVIKPSGIGIVYGYVFVSIIMLVHELGHASALKRFGECTHGLGVGLFFVFPFFYTDVTRSWSLTARQRVSVDLGGLYFQFIVTCPLVLLFAVRPSGALELSICASATMFMFACNPFLRNDGYWALSDLLGKENLKRDSYRALVQVVVSPSRIRWSRMASYALFDTLFLLALFVLAIAPAWHAVRTFDTGLAWNSAYLGIVGYALAPALLAFRLFTRLRNR